MSRWEALARRYCAMLGRDPDAIVGGEPEWLYAVDEVQATMAALASFDIHVRKRFEQPKSAEHNHDESSNILPFPNTAA